LDVRKKVGYLPESVPLYTDLPVKRFLRFAATAKGVEAKKMEFEIDRVTNICGLDKVSHRIIGHLSKGFKQRVGLAQALLNNPPILILDEPTIGLDPTQIIEIRRLIQELRGDHTILLSSHILPEVAQICERVLIINKGQIVATDAPSSLTRQLQKSAEISIELAGDSADLAAALEHIDGVKKVTIQEGNHSGLRVETDRSRDLRPEIARLVVEKGMDLLELKLVDLSLEDIFVQLVTEEPSQEEIQS
jgi:ABC-2 type transport system ATP-binding protein